VAEKVNYQLDGKLDPKDFFGWLNKSLPPEEQVDVSKLLKNDKPPS